MVYLPGVDKVSHALWRSIERQELYPEPLRRPPELRAVRAQALRRYYEFADALLGRLVERFESSDLVLVVSDHGFEAEVTERPTGTLTGGHSSPEAAAGILFARGRGLARGERASGTSIYDVTPTVLTWLGLPVGEDMKGRPAPFLEVEPVPRVATHDDGKHVFCSEPCERIFLDEPERYRDHENVVRRILSGEAPGNVLELLRNYFGLTPDVWGKDARGGDYDWLGVKRGPSMATSLERK